MTLNLYKFAKSIKLILLSLILVAIILKSNLVITSSLSAVKLFMNNLFPCMFIFYTLSDLLINYDILDIFNSKYFIKISNFFRINSNSLFIIFFSMLTGFPSGSKYISDFYKRNLISKEEACFLLTFTHFSNPLFILGTVKNMLGLRLSIIILICHYVSNYIVAFLVRPKKKNKLFNNIEIKKGDLVTVLNKSFKNTFSIILIVVCNSIVFIVLSSLICSFINNKIISFFISGIFDLTKGITSINTLHFSLLFKGIVVCTFLSFGGVNIHMQVKSIISKEKIPYSYFFSGRLVATSICIILFILLYNMLF